MVCPWISLIQMNTAHNTIAKTQCTHYRHTIHIVSTLCAHEFMAMVILLLLLLFFVRLEYCNCLRVCMCVHTYNPVQAFASLNLSLSLSLAFFCCLFVSFVSAHRLFVQISLEFHQVHLFHWSKCEIFVFIDL